MRRFAEIFAVAAERKGSVAALEDILAKTAPRPPPERCQSKFSGIKSALRL